MIALVTGSSGLIGSEAVRYFCRRGAQVHGLDNNMRRDFFGPNGDTQPVLEHLREECPAYRHHHLDVRDRPRVLTLFKRNRFDLVIHCAAQPSHDLAAARPFDDFEINAVGTLNLLEAARRFRPEATFIFMSTNKVYGDAPNELPLVELETRWDYARSEDYNGIDETCRVDASLHSLFGVSKAAADLLVQEYGRYFNMPTVCFRGGCLTGPNHRGVELHGFLAYLIKCAREGAPYTIIGYKGKQVRDQIHSRDVCRAMEAFHAHPRCGAVYNLGGGRANSISVLEAVDRVEQMMGLRMTTTYREQARLGDHICYISDLSRFRGDYPSWDISLSLDDIFEEMVGQAGLVGAGIDS
jgi:CDP-paratose 2-epimerase